MQRHFELTIKEKGGAVLHPSYVGDVGDNPKKFLTGFFGLDNPDVESYEIHEVKYCSICGKRIDGHGNNASPVAEGECCDECNVKRVIPERLQLTRHDNGTERAD